MEILQKGDYTSPTIQYGRDVADAHFPPFRECRELTNRIESNAPPVLQVERS